ncbi:hypothetical protein E2C01_033812 [Portunus trituberculatus]|uniref:Uncharacterized protein n=1 Tax=Portunus trituberculatus TaxID=210409 RepID=A0A5B7F4F8_PORTR|nr:hypothetical protein [Portunus trituberculatus]
MIVECDRYEEERRQLVAQITEIIGEEEWNKRLAEEYGGSTTIRVKGEAEARPLGTAGQEEVSA